MDRKRRRSLRPLVDLLDDRCLLTTTTVTPPPPPAGLSPVQLKSAYGLNALQFISEGVHYAGDGSGQTIAIVDAYHDPYAYSDLQTFDKQFGLPDPQFTQDNLSGDWNTNDDTAGETTLDIEWAHAMAPGANIVLVETPNDTVQGLLQGINYARNLPNVSVVSLSYGYPELDVPDPQQYDSIFTTPPGHQGVTFLASSGDSGTSTALGGGVSWPASSPNVVAVGGTTLGNTLPTGAQGESIWGTGFTTQTVLGTSGGYSSFEPEPSYQDKLQSTGQRSVPDVSMLADPNTGVAWYFTTPSIGVGQWGVVGGTSLSAPLWGGIISIVNEGRAFLGETSLDGPSETLPALYALPSTDFSQVAATPPGFGLSYTYGPVTSPATLTTVGLGSPAGASLIYDLVNPPTHVKSTVPYTGTSTPPSNEAAWGLVAPTSGSTTPPHKPTKRSTHKTSAPKKVLTVVTKPASHASKTVKHITAAKATKTTPVSAPETASQARLIAAFDAAIPTLG